MNYPTLILFYFLAILASVLFTKSPINPLSIYSLIWGGVVSLYQFRLSVLQPALSSETYATLLVALVCFSLTYFIFFYFRLRDNHRIKQIKYVVSWNRLVSLLKFFVLIELVEIIYSGGVPLLWYITGNGKDYVDFGISSLHGLMNSLGLVLIILSTYTALVDYCHRKQGIAITLGLLVYYLMLVTRQVIISAILEIIIVVLALKPVHFKVKYILYLLAGILGFGIIGNFRTGYESFLSVSMIDSSLPPFLSGFLWIYMYTTMSVANINSLVHSAISFVGLAPVVAEFAPNAIVNALGISTITQTHLVTQAFNVSGYFVEFYYACGVVGVAIISSIYGVISGIAHKSYLCNKNQRNIILYAVVIQIVSLSFFFNQLLYLPSGFQLILITMICSNGHSEKRMTTTE